MMMRRLSVVLIFGLIISAGMPAGISGDAASSGIVTIRNAPRKLVEAWLRFHEMDLCQGVDAVFEFDKSGMKAWCLIEDKKKYEKFVELLEPLQDSYRIELCATLPPISLEPDGKYDPPANLWENKKLRSYLGNLYAPNKLNSGVIDFSPEIDPITNSSEDDVLRRLLFIYADQTQDWNIKIKKYATDLPALAHLAGDSGMADDLRFRANAACMAHSRGLGKYLKKLKSNLAPAIPKSKKRDEDSSQPGKTIDPGKTLVDKAEQISTTAQDLFQSVENFIHPEKFTVDLDELRSPNILVTIDALETMCADFETELDKYHSK